MHTRETTDYDIAIVGGGPVGMSLALALADSGRRTVLIEASSSDLSQQPPSWDERCIALNEVSVRILSAWGLWPALLPEAAPILATHICERGRFGSAHFDAAELGIGALGYNVPLRAIGLALQTALRRTALEWLRPARLRSLQDIGGQVQLELETDSGPRHLRARLVVGADGTRSAVREQLGIGTEVHDYQQQAIVSSVQLRRDHHGVAWERFCATGPLALIPKPGLAASLVWTLPAAQVPVMLALAPDDYRRQAHEAFGGRAGPFLALGQRWAYPLARVLSRAITGPRTVLLGNAAQTLHPVAAQGFNLGLRDVAALAERLQGSGLRSSLHNAQPAQDPGDAGLLAAYAEGRRRDRDRTAGITNLMVRTFSNRLPGLAQLRHWGLIAADLTPGLREEIMRQHLGRVGLPRFAAGVTIR